LAAEDKEKYRQAIYEATENKLKNNGVSAGELDTESKSELEKLKNKQITEKNEVDEAEKKIVKNVYEKAATKKLTDLEKRVDQVLKSKDEEEIKRLQQELIQLINNSNYQSKKSVAEALNKKLENALNQSNTSNDNGGIPWKVVVPITLVAVAFLAGVIIYSRKRKLKHN